MEKYYKWLLGLGILLHLAFALITYHPDLRAFILAGKFINQGEVFTFYDHVSKLPANDTLKKSYGDDIFIYPPLAYLIPAAIQFPFSGLLKDSYNSIIADDSVIYHNNFFFLPLLIFKFPTLLFSLLILVFIPKLFDKKEQGHLAQILWLYFPTNFVVSSGMGQVDAILTFFLLMSFIYIRKGSLGKASVFVMLSALIKPLGLILLPLIAIYAFKKTGLVSAIKAIIPGIITWLIIIAPFITSPAFKMYALFGTLTSKTVYAGIAIASATTIPWFFILLTLICILLYEQKISLFNALGFTILSSLAFSHFHPQWFLWIVPWLIFTSIKENKLYLLLMFLISWILVWLSFDMSLHIGMILSLKESFSAAMYNPINNSQIVLLGRAAIISGLIYLIAKLQNEK